MFKIFAFWGVCALVGQPIHLLEGRLLDTFFAFWFSGFAFGTFAIIAWHVITHSVPVPQWMRDAHGVVVDVRPDAQILYCIDCGYDLRGLPSDRCPECGWLIDRDLLGRSHLAWAHRARLGRWRAYWRTAWAGTRSMKRLAVETIRPVDVGDALKFANITALVVGVPFALGILAIYAFDGTGIFNLIGMEYFWNVSKPVPAAKWVVPWAEGMSLVPVAPLGAIAMFFLIVRSSAMFFGGGAVPLERKERAAALSRYAMGALAWTPPMVLIGLAALAAAVLDGNNTLNSFWFTMSACCAVGFGICLLACLFNTLALFWRTNQPSQHWFFAVMIGLPMTWCASAVVALGVAPWVIGYVWLMFDSLR